MHREAKNTMKIHYWIREFHLEAEFLNRFDHDTEFMMSNSVKSANEQSGIQVIFYSYA